MSQTTENKETIKFSARVVTSGQTETLEVTVTNGGDAAWADQLLIDLKLPSRLVTTPVKDASLKARTNKTPPSMATLAGVAGVAAGWSVWAANEPNDDIAVVRLFNYVNQTNGSFTSPAKFEKGAQLTFSVPLAQGASSGHITIPYGYQVGRKQNTRIDGQLVLPPATLPAFSPKVSFRVDHESPTMIKPGTEVKIFWKIENGVSATLRGPLSGGNNKLDLDNKGTGDYRLDEGAVTVYAVGPATYILDAEVRGPGGPPNVQVIRTVMLDVFTAEKYGNLVVRPPRVLPHGQVEIDWAVWGVASALLEVSDRGGITLKLTEQDYSRGYHGKGTLRINASPELRKEDVGLTLTITEKPKTTTRTDATINSVVWSKWGKADKPRVSGRPVALSANEAHMALLTSEGLWIARVGSHDFDRKTPFAKTAARFKSGHALTAFGEGFVVLGKTASGDLLVLDRYDTGGKPFKSPVNLPDSVKPLTARDDTSYQLVAFGERVYVVVEGSTQSGRARQAFSVGFDPDELRPEPWLERLNHHRLVVFDNALYTLRRGTGEVFRFELTAEGALDQPRRAASAVKGGQSLIHSGLLIPLGNVLAVLDPAGLPPPEETGMVAMFNVGGVNIKDLLRKETGADVPQDLVYDPQHNRWDACGHGLDVQPGAVGAFRPGESARIWVFQPDGEMHTLQSATVELFAPDYVNGFPSASLPPVLDAKLEATLLNLTGSNFVPVDDACRAAGLVSLSATGLAELSTPLGDVPTGLNGQPFTILYDSAAPGTVTVRLLARRPPGHRYVLELTFSGDGLKNVSSVFKRLSPEGQVTEVPDTRQQHTLGEGNTLRLEQIHLRMMRTRWELLILNATTRDLSASPEINPAKISEGLRVGFSYETPDFQIAMAGMEQAGRLNVNIDYAQPYALFEALPAVVPQRGMVRIKTDDAGMLEVRTHLVNALVTKQHKFKRYDGSEASVPLSGAWVYVCEVGLKTKRELDGLRLGDGVISRDEAPAIYIPLLRPQDSMLAQVLKVENASFTHSKVAEDMREQFFSLPNAVAVSDRTVHAMFYGSKLYESNRMREGWFTTDITGYDSIAALAATPSGVVFMVARRNEGFPEKLARYFLLEKQPAPNNSIKMLPLDKIRFPVGVPSMAVSPHGNIVAVADQGGMQLASFGDKVTIPVSLEGAREPGHVVFSHDARFVYSVHSSNSMGFSPRRAVAGREITVSRVWPYAHEQQRATLKLPDADGNFSITASTRQSFNPNVAYKEQTALTLAVSPDNKSLFVSAGTTIMKIDADTFTLTPWRASVELPCRLIGVGKGWGNAWTLYALGSLYRGDGTRIEEQKTHLYAIPAPVS